MTSWGGTWTETKKRVVKQYLDAYQTALKYQPFEKWYIDAFAGIGTHSGKQDDDPTLPFEFYGRDELAMNEDNEFRCKGSPLLALQTNPPFDRYNFIEKEKRRSDALVSTIEGLGFGSDNKIAIKNADANSCLFELCEYLRWNRNIRVVLFLDPFGMNVSWECIEKIASLGCFDVWYLFPTMAVKRMLPNNAKVPVQWEERLNFVLGGDGWKSYLYHSKSEKQATLPFEELHEETSDIHPAKEKEIEQYVITRMKRRFAFVADNPLSLYNTRSKHIFSLIFAMSNKSRSAISLGRRIAEFILEANREVT